MSEAARLACATIVHVLRLETVGSCGAKRDVTLTERSWVVCGPVSMLAVAAAMTCWEVMRSEGTLLSVDD